MDKIVTRVVSVAYKWLRVAHGASLNGMGTTGMGGGGGGNKEEMIDQFKWLQLQILNIRS